ncbi:MAG: BTAD domain-containing putative transcriptional regulator [Anaerolineales bacterium]
MDTIEIRLLGSPQIERNGQNITADLSEKALALLAYLVTRDREVSRLEIAGLLWEAMDETRARANLRAALHNLRISLPDILEVSRSSIALAIDHNFRLDLAELQAALQRIGSEDFYSAFAAVVGVYRGDFLEGFYGNAGPEFEAWVLEAREHLRVLYLNGLELFTERVITHGDWQKALQLTNQVLSIDPWSESAHRRLMRLHARMGHCNRALAQFETCRTVLDQELGIAPEAETWQLYEKIRSASYCPAHNLPAFPTAFIGREGELAILREWLKKPGCRLITITGLCGMGKTRLAVELGSRIANGQNRTFMHGVRYASMTERRSGEAYPEVFARALGISIQTGQQPADQLLNYLRSKEMLLIIDHVEPEAPEVRFLPEVLRAAPDVKVIIISPARTYLQGEWLFDLEGLSYPEHIPPVQDINALRQYDALRFFLDCANRLNLPGFMKNAGGAIMEICRLTEGMPLALELAAAHLREMEPDQIVQDINRNLDLLSARIIDLPARHCSLRGLLETAWQSLSATTRKSLADLVQVEGEFSQETAWALAGVAPEALTALVDCSLVRMSSPHRYELPRLVRCFLQQKAGIHHELALGPIGQKANFM